MIFSEMATDKGIFVDGDWIESKDQDPLGEVRLIQLADIGEGVFIDKSDRYITSEKAKELSCTMLQEGDVLISRLGTPLCKACIFPYSGKYITSVDIAILRVGRQDINPKYIVYLVNSNWFKLQAKKYESGTTRKRISRKNLDKIDIGVPSLEEQNKIVSRIEECFSSIDNAVETLNKTKEQLAVYRQAVLREAFEGDYKEIPLGEISTVISGYAFKSKKYDANGKYVVVKIGNVKERRFDFSRDLTRTNEADDSIIKKYLLQEGDCLITQTGSRGKRDYGFVSMISNQSNYLLNQRVAALRFNKEIALPSFFQYYLSSPDYRDKFFSYETGNVGQGNVGIKALSEPMVILPSIEEQQKIIQRIESHLSTCNSIEETVNSTLSQAKAMRQSVLKEAFEGRLA